MLASWPTSVLMCPMCVRSDNGLEFINPDFVGWLDCLRIRREHTPVGSPKPNGSTTA